MEVVYFGVLVHSELMCSHTLTPKKHPQYILFRCFMHIYIKTILQSRNKLFHLICIFTSGPTKSSLMSLFYFWSEKTLGGTKSQVTGSSQEVNASVILSKEPSFCLYTHNKKRKKNKPETSEYLHTGRRFPICPFSVTLKCF